MKTVGIIFTVLKGIAKVLIYLDKHEVIHLDRQEARPKKKPRPKPIEQPKTE